MISSTHEVAQHLAAGGVASVLVLVVVVGVGVLGLLTIAMGAASNNGRLMTRGLLMMAMALGFDLVACYA